MPSDNKQKKPSVSALIEDCILKIADIMEGKKIGIETNQLKACVDMLVTIDKNERDAKSSMSRDISNLSEEELDRELEALTTKKKQ